MTRVLVVDDDPQILRTLSISLRAGGFTVVAAGDAEEALGAAAVERPDVVVLDLGLPDMDGVRVIGGLREWSRVPILVLSGRSDSADKVDALDAGADDYVTKPFGMDELLARLRAMTRRTASAADAAEATVEFGDVSVDLVAKRILRGSDEVRLTPTEWHLLEAFLRHSGVLMSQAELLREVWGPGYETAQGNLRLYVNQLRRKLEPDPSRPRHFRNEPGLGYRFEPR